MQGMLGEIVLFLSLETDAKVVNCQSLLHQHVALWNHRPLDRGNLPVLNFIFEQPIEGINNLLSVDAGQTKHNILEVNILRELLSFLYGKLFSLI